MAKTFVDAEIQKPAVVFSKTYCPFCKMAKNVLSEIGAQYALHELDERGRWGLEELSPIVVGEWETGTL